MRGQGITCVTQADIDRYWRDEFYDLIIPFIVGEKKHGKLNWMEPDGHTSSHKDNCASLFRHLSEHSAGHDLVHDAPYDPLLAVACRALMQYYRKQNGIVHPDDMNRMPYETYGKDTSL